VPGAIDAPMAVGCLELARNGATIIRDGRDAAEPAGPIAADPSPHTRRIRRFYTSFLASGELPKGLGINLFRN